MKTYEYRGLDASGRRKRGLIEAQSLKQARGRLAGQGVYVERITQSGRAVRIGIAERAALYHELSSLIQAGMPLLRALGIMLEAPGGRRTTSVLASVRDQVREGASLATALSDAGRGVGEFERALVATAERSATLGVMLERLGEYLEEQERLRARAVNAMVYPAIVFGVGILVGSLMLGFLLPKAGQLVAEGGGTMPALTVFMVALGKLLARYGLVVAGLLALGVMMCRRRLRSEAVRSVWHRRILRWPVLGKGMQILVTMRFSRTLGILLGSGVPLVDALDLAGRSTGNAAVAADVRREADSVRQGSSLADAVSRIEPLAASLPGWIRVGEEGGGLSELLQKAATRQQELWERYVTRCLSLLEPALILVIGGFVLLVTISILLPILSITTQFGVR